ncbi:DUF6817 domain-containing protein [Plantactinospora sp. WMMB334]|uniref:DUF6817 domain-containing protein n=1 Tax=Plantactinospora sp. WMMB334 TaxID=3404119 RepID=UPI003B956105
MTTAASYPDKIAFLERHGTGETAHSGADLLAHLKGVHDLLLSWGERAALCDAGLFHSVYGTDIFPTGTVEHGERPEVRALIGEEAEIIAYLFGTLTRGSIFDAAFDGPPFLLESRAGETVGVTDAQYADLAAVTVANWLEQRPRFAESRRRSREREFGVMRGYLSAAARHALEDAYGFAPLTGPTE